MFFFFFFWSIYASSSFRLYVSVPVNLWISFVRACVQTSTVFSLSPTIICLSAICPSLKHQLFSREAFGGKKKQPGDYALSFMPAKMFCTSLSYFSSRKSLLWGLFLSAFWRFYLSMCCCCFPLLHLCLKWECWLPLSVHTLMLVIFKFIDWTKVVQICF